MLDQHSPAVRQLVDEMDTEIERLRAALERPGKTAAQYDVYRGQIKGLRWSLKKLTGEEEELTDG